MRTGLRSLERVPGHSSGMVADPAHSRLAAEVDLVRSLEEHTVVVAEEQDEEEHRRRRTGELRRTEESHRTAEGRHLFVLREYVID